LIYLTALAALLCCCCGVWVAFIPVVAPVLEVRHDESAADPSMLLSDPGEPVHGSPHDDAHFVPIFDDWSDTDDGLEHKFNETDSDSDVGLPARVLTITPRNTLPVGESGDAGRAIHPLAKDFKENVIDPNLPVEEHLDPAMVALRTWLDSMVQGLIGKGWR